MSISKSLTLTECEITNQGRTGTVLHSVTSRNQPVTDAESAAVDAIRCHPSVEYYMKGLLFPDNDVTGRGRIIRFIRGGSRRYVDAYKRFLANRLVEANRYERLGAQVVGMGSNEFDKWWIARRHPYMGLVPVGGSTEYGEPIVWLRLQSIDPVRFLDERTKTQGLTSEIELCYCFCEWLQWRLNKNSTTTGLDEDIRLQYAVAVVDCKSRSPGAFLNIRVTQFISRLIETVRNDFCESLRCVVLINVTFGIKMLLNFVMPLLSSRQRKKFVVIPNPEDDYGKRILKDIGLRQVPKMWGGNGAHPNVVYEYRLDSTGGRKRWLKSYTRRRNDATSKPFGGIDCRRQPVRAEGLLISIRPPLTMSSISSLSEEG